MIADEFDERGDTLIAHGEVRARARASGVELVQDVTWLLRFEADMVIYMRTYFGHVEDPAAVE